MDRRERGILSFGIAAAWAVALWAAVGTDVSRDDVSWLSGMEEFLRGFEARKGYAHAAWGLLHGIGHQLAPKDAWAEGRIGLALSVVATFAVPWCAFVAWRVARSVAPSVAPLAALLAATSPAVAWGASTPNFGIRSVAAGFGLLGAVRALDGLRDPRRTDLPAATALVGVGLLFHPWAVTGPMVLFPLLLWEGRRLGRLPRSILSLGAMFGLCVLSFALMAQGQRASLAEGNPLLPKLMLLFVPWGIVGYQSPGLGAVLAQLPAPASVAAGLALLGWSFRQTTARALPWMLLGGFFAALPEAAAPGLMGSVGVVLSGNHAKASFGAEMTALVAVAVLLSRLGGTRAALLVLVLALPRFALVSHRTAEIARADSLAGRRLAAELLVPAAFRGVEPSILGDPMVFSAAVMQAKWLPDLPPSRRALKKNPADRGAEGMAGLDYALLRTTAQRCVLWLGPQRLLNQTSGTLCDRPPRRGDVGTKNPCVFDLSHPEVPGGCGDPPAHANAASTLDARALPLALLALLALGLGLVLATTLRET